MAVGETSNQEVEEPRPAAKMIRIVSSDEFEFHVEKEIM